MDTEKEIIVNQLLSDLDILEKEVNAGMYKNNVEGYLKEIDRIFKKVLFVHRDNPWEQLRLSLDYMTRVLDLLVTKKV